MCKYFCSLIRHQIQSSFGSYQNDCPYLEKIHIQHLLMRALQILCLVSPQWVSHSQEYLSIHTINIRRRKIYLVHKLYLL